MAIQLGHNRPSNFLFLTRQRLGSQHQIFESESYYTIRLSGPELLEENHSHFDEDIKGILISNKHCIVHLIGFKSIPRGNWLKSLIGLVRELESDGRFCRFIGLSKDLRLQFREQGIDGVLRASNGLAHALEEMGLSAKHSIDVDFVNPFISATVEIFEHQAKLLELKPGKLSAKKAGETYSGDISGVMGIVSESFRGNIAVSMTEKTFANVMTQMFGLKTREINEETKSVIGDLIHMIFGKAKTRLNEKGYEIQQAMPSIVTGKEQGPSPASSRGRGRGVAVSIPFTSSGGDFFIEISRNF